MKNTLFALLFLVLCCHAFDIRAQVTVNGVSVNISGNIDPAASDKYILNTCKEELLNGSITTTTAVTHFQITFPVNPNLSILYQDIVDPNITVDESTHSIFVESIQASTPFNFQIPVKALCSNFGATNQISSESLVIQYAGQSSAQQTLNFNIYSGVIDYNSADDDADNISYIGHKNDPEFTRRYNFNVTKDFNGDILLDEDVPVSMSINSIVVRVTSNNGSSTLATFTTGLVDPVTNKLMLIIPLHDIPAPSVVEILEKVTVIGCPDSRGNIKISYGCDGNYCQKLTGDIGMALVSTKGPGAPILSIVKDASPDFSSCLNSASNSIQRTYILKNSGTADANDVRFTFRAAKAGFPLNIIPQNNFTINAFGIPYQLDGEYLPTLAEARNNRIVPTGVGECYDESTVIVYNKSYSIPVLKKEESITISWTEMTCCVSSDQNAYELFDVGFEDTKYKDECDTDVGYAGITTGNYAEVTPASQIEVTGLTNMFGCKDCGSNTGCFGNPAGNCLNTTLNNPNGTSADFTDQLTLTNSGFNIKGALPIDQNKFRIIIDFGADGNLLLAPQEYAGATHVVNSTTVNNFAGNIFMTDGKGNIHYPVSQSDLSATQMSDIFNTTNVPVGARAIFEFDITQILSATNIQLYELHGYKSFDYATLNDFVNSLKVNFEVSAVCNKSFTDQSAFYEKIYIQPTSDCADCMLSIASIKKNILVNCPGCIFPGVVTTEFKIERLTVGLNDGDNNGFPDNIVNANEKPNLRMVTDNDIFEIKTGSNFWGGTYRTYGDGTNPGSLEQEAGFGSNFLTNLCRLDLMGTTYGNNIKVSQQKQVKVVYTSQALGTTFTLLFNSSDVATSNNGNFLFQFPLPLFRQTMTAQNISNAANFQFAAADRFDISSYYEVIPGFDLGSDYYTNVDVASRCFYSGTTKDVLILDETDPSSPYGLLKTSGETDLALLHNYTNFICEAFGGGFVLADLKDSYRFYGDNQPSCVKTLVQQYNVSTDFYGRIAQLDLFPNEVRSFNRVTTFQFVLPKGYLIDYTNSDVHMSHSFRNNEFNYSTFDQTKSFANILAANPTAITQIGPSYQIRPNGTEMVGTLYKVEVPYNASLYYRANTDYPNSTPAIIMGVNDQFYDFNEYGKQFLNLQFTPDCSQDINYFNQYMDDPTQVASPGFLVEGFYRLEGPRAFTSDYNFSTNTFNSPIEHIDIRGDEEAKYTIPHAEITVGTPIANINIFRRDQLVPFTLTVTEGNTNLFVYFTSDNNIVQIGDLFLNDGSLNPTPITRVNGIYPLGMFSAGQVLSYNLSINVACSNSNSSLTIHTGYICDLGYPTYTTENGLSKAPCSMKETTIPILQRPASIGVSYSSLASSDICTTISGAIKITSLLEGALYGFNVSATLPTGLTYFGNSVLKVYNSDGTPKTKSDGSVISYNISSVSLSGNIVTWDLTSLHDLDNVLINNGSYLLLTYDSKPTCQYYGGDLSAAVNAVSYCGAALTASLPTPAHLTYDHATCFPLAVVLSYPTLVCNQESFVLTADVTQGATTGMTYTWYKYTNGTRVKIAGPLATNTYTINGGITANTQFEVELNNGNGCSTTDARTITIGTPDQCCTYKLGDITLNCSASTQNICVPLTAVRDVPAGIIGMDFCLKYDPTVMSYTGPTDAAFAISSTVVTNDGLYSANYATYNDAVNGVLRVSIFYTGGGTSTGLASFKGSGQIICLNFSVPNSSAHQGIFPITMCTINDLQEAYTLEEKAACWKPGSLTINIENVANGRLENPLYGTSISGRVYETDYASTSLTLVGSDCDVNELLPSIPILGTGFFNIPTNGQTKIKIKRDIKGDKSKKAYMQYQLAVNGSDTWKIHRITTMDPALNQNNASDELKNLYWFAIVAADVNMNGHVRANDISLLQERIVGKRSEFPQVWNDGLSVPSLDWRFVDQTTVGLNPSFIKSTIYPNSDGHGFYREYLPNIPLCLDIQRNCSGQEPRAYYGVMLGDVYNSYTGGTSAPLPGLDPYLRTSSDPSSITIDAKHAQYLDNNIYRVPVIHNYNYKHAKNLFAIDMYMDYNQQKIRVNNVQYTSVTTDGGVSMMWNNADEDQFILTSYATLDSIAGTGISYYLDIEKFTDEPFTKANFGEMQFLLNGELVEAKVETGETVTGTTDGQSAIKPHVTVIPNPASGDAMIDFAVSNNSNSNQIIITDVLGRMVKSFDHVQNFGMLNFNTTDLAAGMYIITLKGENGFGLSDKFQVRK